MRRDYKIGMLVAVAAITAGAALVPVPQLFPDASNWFLATWFVGGATVTVGLLIWAVVIARGDKPESSPPPPEVVAHPDRIYVTVSASYLAGLFKEHTAVQGTKLFEAYVGKWMLVTAVVRNVLPHQDGTLSVMAAEKSWRLDTPSIAMAFSKESVDRVAMLKIGDPIRGSGIIASADSYLVVLKGCELSPPR